MREMIVSLSPGVDENLLKNFLENVKGVWKITFREVPDKKPIDKTEIWINNLRSIRDDIDHSLIDMDDERTKYLLSK